MNCFFLLCKHKDSFCSLTTPRSSQAKEAQGKKEERRGKTIEDLEAGATAVKCFSEIRLQKPVKDV